MFFLVTTIYYAVLCTFISSSVRDRHAKLRDGTCEAVRPRWVCQFNVCFWAVCVCSLFYSSLSSLMALRMTPEFAIDMHWKSSSVLLFIIGLINAIDLAIICVTPGLASSYGYRWRAIPWKALITSECLFCAFRCSRTRTGKLIEAPRNLAVAATPAEAALWQELEDSMLAVICVSRDLRVAIWSAGAADLVKMGAAPRTLRDLPFRTAEDRARAIAQVEAAFAGGVEPRKREPFVFWLDGAGGALALSVEAIASSRDGVDSVALFCTPMDPMLLSFGGEGRDLRGRAAQPTLKGGAPGEAPTAVQRLFRSERSSAAPLLSDGGSVPELYDGSVVSYDSVAETPRVAGERGKAGPVGVDFETAEGPDADPSEVLLLQFRASTGRMTGKAFAPHAGVTRAPDLTERSGVLRRGVTVDRPGVYAWAYVWGETFVRVSAPSSYAAPWVFGGFGGATSWRHLVDLVEESEDDSASDPAMAATKRCVGGHVEVGEDSTLLRWCVRLEGVTDPEVVLPLAGRVPLPFEKLWLVSLRHDGYLKEFSGGGSLAELEASGRLQVVSDAHVVLKATTVSAEVYAAAKRRVKAFAKARQELKRAHAAPSATEAELDDARRAYDAAKKHIQAAFATYLRGNEERQARRSLGILDERYSRHQTRLELLFAGNACERSSLARLPENLVEHVAGYITMTDHDLHIACSRNATPPDGLA